LCILFVQIEIFLGSSHSIFKVIFPPLDFCIIEIYTLELLNSVGHLCTNNISSILVVSIVVVLCFNISSEHDHGYTTDYSFIHFINPVDGNSQSQYLCEEL
jgi:hypothetical protein